LKDKTIDVIPDHIDGCDDAWGCAPLNSPAGHAFFEDIVINVPPAILKKQGKWTGNPNDGLGVLLGMTISHEAGHAYGIEHSNSGIMNPNTTVRPRLHLNWWDQKAQKRLTEVLGLKQP